MSAKHPKILHESITIPFYKQNMGLLGFIFFLLFGMQQHLMQALAVHYALIVYFISHINNLLILIAISLVYVLKCIAFYNNLFKTASYDFLQLTNGVAYTKRLGMFAPVAVLLLAPLLIYWTVVFVIAIQQHAISMIVLTGLCSLAFVIMLTVFMLYKNSHPRSSFLNTHILPKINIQLTLTTLLMRFLLHQKTLLLLSLKLVAFISLYYMVHLDNNIFEERMLWLLFTMIITAHAIMVYQCYTFLETACSFYKALPIKIDGLLLQFFCFYMLLLLPEMYVLKGLIHAQQSGYTYIIMLATAPLMLLFFHTILYTENYTVDKYLQLILGLWLLFFFSGFAENKWILPLALAAGSIIMMYTSFRKHEYMIPEKK